ncbi:MAG: RNA polymerase sigma factor [Elusimicrobia bacterium]|nr:RNA polymerase sigma factor [Elusimicrobiota bacterium]
MKKTCKTFGSDGKGDGQASKRDVIGEALKLYLSGQNTEAFGFAYSLCRDEGEARELVQEACYRMLRESERYDRSRPVKSWLFTILRNVFTDTRRRASRRHGLSLDLLSDDGESLLVEVIAGPEEAPPDRLEREETSARLKSAMRRLKADDRRLLTLCDIEGLSYEDAAKLLDVPMGTVRSRLSRARAKLRRLAVAFELR